jgi:uncharacterized membrane-anchored protein
MNKRTAIVLFIALGIALQFAVPASMIAKHELTLRRGGAFRFKTAPVDPFDAFRGRYVALNFEALSAIRTDRDPGCKRGRRCYLILGTDTNGFAAVTGVTNRPPAAPHLTATFQWTHEERIPTGVVKTNYYPSAKNAPPSGREFWTEPVTRPTGRHIVEIAHLPFDRFYLPERLAPQAETAYREASRRDSTTAATALVRVRDGHAAVEDLLIGDLPLKEYLKRHPDSPKPETAP